jgi:uncharacterized protein YjiS (DUF1127 family)
MIAATFNASTPKSIPLVRPTWSRAWTALEQAWAVWREKARRQAEAKALAQLDRRTLVDLGLGEFASEPTDRAVWRVLDSARW